MKVLYNLTFFIFCVLTLGFVDVIVKYSDGTSFEWIGWISRMLKGGEQ